MFCMDQMFDQHEWCILHFVLFALLLCDHLFSKLVDLGKFDDYEMH